MQASSLFLKRAFRNKKNIFLFFIFVLSFLLILLSLELKVNFNSYIDNLISQYISFRRVTPIKKLDENTIEKIKKDEHFLYLIPSNYIQMSLLTEDFDKNDYDGYLDFIVGLERVAPRVILGKNLTNDSNNEIICPYNFYPDSSASLNNINENKILNADDYLNKKIKVKYSSSEVIDDQLVKTGDYEKELKIVGFFDNTLTSTSSNECFMSYNTIKEIADLGIVGVQYSDEIIVDKAENAELMQLKLKELGYDSELGAIFKDDLIKTIKFVLNAIIIISIVVTMIIVMNYYKKQFINDKKFIQMQLNIGYSKKQIIILKFIEMIPILVLAFVVGTIIYGLIIFIIEKFLTLKLNLLGVVINYHPLFILTSLFLSLLIPLILALFVMFYKNIFKEGK